MRRKFWLPLAMMTGLILVIMPVLAACQTSTPTSTSTPTPTVVVAAREPKRLEMKVTIEMGEMFFAGENGTKGGPFKVPAGKTVGIYIVNNGVVEHEIMFGREIAMEEGKVHGYHHSLFEDVPVDVFVYPSGKKIEVETEGMLEEIELEAGAPGVWLRVNFPLEAKGVWEIGCFVPGHYEAGMKAVFIVE